MAWSLQSNIKGPQGIQGIQGVQGPAGQDGAGIEIAGTVATYAALPTNLTGTDAGKGYLVTADGLLYIWDGAQFPADGSGTQFRGPQGLQGPKGDTGATGSAGSNGSAATIAVGATTTGGAGTNAAVSNSGTSGAAVFDFTIPRGDTGAQGIQGVKGDQGNTGAVGTAATIAVGTVATGAPGSSAAVVNGGTSSAASFNFTIPRGDKGDQGTPGTTGNTGATGARGSKWFTGAGAPGTITGAIAGDFYLEDNGDVYTLS